MQGIFFLHEIKGLSSSRSSKKNSTVEKFVNEKASVGQIPTQPPQSIHDEGVNDGILSTISIVSTGQLCTHFVHSENLLVARTQLATSNAKFILCYTFVLKYQ